MPEQYTPRHRANKLQRTQPRVQPTPKHAGEYEPEDRILGRLGAVVFDIDEFRNLLHDIGPGNPFKRGGVR